mmetsp:Transcript_108979/g.307149  ORF Transcript_108979/g.307149 Transcript_108979/m.307149 type:complete len:334 (-) Transcript_108979:165-1166(-)
MSITPSSIGGSEFGGEHPGYSRHRFDNYSAWLDREHRLRALKENKHLGWGYDVPKKPAPPREPRKFHVLENAFTSGQLLTREYEHKESSFKCETNRADAHHYPNYMGVREDHHYMDHRRRSCHPDPSRWKPLPGDAILRDAVSDEMVQTRITAEKGERRRHIPPEVLAMREAEVRLDASSVRELKKDERVDLSCVDMPNRENPEKPSPAVSRTRWALSGNPAAPPPAPNEPPAAASSSSKAQDPKWSWCLGGRPSNAETITPQEMNIVKSRSLPTVLPGQSMLVGNNGLDATAFHGVTTRSFGSQRVDYRMRGGRLARDGWAGTFPEREKRCG